MQYIHMRNGFSMITAIFVIVIMGSISAFVMALSGKTVKITTAQYQHEQAELYAKSYTEYAILAVTGNNRHGVGVNCLTDINGTIGTPATGNGYQITVNINYIGNSINLGSCYGTRLNTTKDVITQRTPLTILIDVYARYKDPENPSGSWLTVHRRSVQKI
ncbi:MAG: type II secretion system protein [Sulfurovum sp.]|nr:type II secretion system protein [Sulfurovum sp.]MCB4753338.1 type II secretion system protein [Sulfurovum sp.]MCB4754757.1 type II secretion system protein [Sulfurovum sp.]MCB4761647.1 type II secretion system protein [Sulfurovum sp.]MCB4780346.1 type II secretion system protein [Sulfurovum sp.]